MTRTPPSGRRSGPYLIALAMLLAGLLLFAPLPSVAAEDNTAALSNDEISELVETLEDPAERERFLSDLKALLAARQALDETAKAPAPAPRP